MNNDHRYIFEKGSKKHHCPDCTKKRYVRYIDTDTGKYIPKQYGRCDRESKCGYLLNPYKDGYSKAVWEQEQGNKIDWEPQRLKSKKKPLNKPKRAFIPVEVLNRTRAGYDENVFIQNLLTAIDFPFESQDVEKVISLYHLGTIQNGYRSGATTFPFIDVNNNIRAVQVKQFDEKNHTKGTDFLHSIIEKQHTRNNKPLPVWLEEYNKNETKVSCLFGEHLLSKYPHNPVALVEAPKTAIYGTLYFGVPEQPTNFLWLAVYNLSSLNLSKCRALKGRNVSLFPDLSKDGKAFELWSEKAATIQKQLQGTYFQVSELLEQLASDQDKEKGKDIADYLILQDWRLFRNQIVNETSGNFSEPDESSLSEKRERSEGLKTTFISQPDPLPQVEIINPFESECISEEQPENWNNEITELENFFDKIQLPSQPIELNGCSTITDCKMFIRTHLNTVMSNNGNQTFLPYLIRLQELKQVLTINQN